MKIGMRGHDFGKMPPEVLFEFIKSKGFDTIQLAPVKAILGINSFNDITETYIEKIKEEATKAKVEISVLGCYIEPSLIDKEARLSQVAIFQKNIQYAKAFGSFIGTETTRLSPDTPISEREKIYSLLLDSVLRMVETAEKYNVDIVIEPVSDHTLNTAELTKRLIEDVDSDRLKLIFDPFNVLLPSEIDMQPKVYDTYFELVGKYIEIIHMKGLDIQNKEKVWTTLEKGLINYEHIFNWLHKNKPNIPILREHIMLETYKEDLEFMRRYGKRT